MIGTSVVKNSFGISCVTSGRICHPDKIGTFGGSAINREEKSINIKKLLRESLIPEEKRRVSKVRDKKLLSMSQRTKSKIRKKIIAFAMVCSKLTFLTLTFCNKVDDKTAIKIFRAFLANARRRFPDIEYIWVVERQQENEAFRNNIHFHLITNKYWKIEKWWQYWLDLQAKAGVMPRKEGYKPSSAFDIRKINSNNIKGIVNYMTKYVTKNNSQFEFQVWNCSKRVSRLYTDFYSDVSIIAYLEKLENENLIGGELKRVQKEFCKLFIIPLNQTTMRLYERIKERILKYGIKIQKNKINMFNSAYNGLHNPFQSLNEKMFFELAQAKSFLAIYYPQDGGRTKVVVSDLGEEEFSLILLSLLYNPNFFDLIKGAVITADQFKKEPSKAHKVADRMIEYFRKVDNYTLHKFYNDIINTQTRIAHSKYPFRNR